MIITEEILNFGKLDDIVLNDNNYETIEAEFRKNGVAIIDNFLKEEYVQRLRNFGLHYKRIDDYWVDYTAVNFSKTGMNCWFPLLTNVSEELIGKFNCLKDLTYSRGWVFVHDNIQHHSVKRHIDPNSKITVNVWCTPDECVEENTDDYNGLILHMETGKIHIPYKFNRAMIFYSDTEHESQLSRFKLGLENKKVNYTFLFK